MTNVKLNPGGIYHVAQMTGRNMEAVEAGIRLGVKLAHGASFDVGWWENPDCTLMTDPLLVPAKIALMHSELSEAMEAHRKDLMDDKLPNRPGIEVEFADAILRIFDLCGALRLDLAGALVEKMQFNKNREDHKRENREKPGGKAY